MSGLKVKTKVKVIGDENVKIIFRAYLRQNSIDLRQIKTRTITAHYTYIVKYILPAETFRFVIFVCLSVTYLSFIQHWNVVKSLYFSDKLPVMLVNSDVILR